jgi:hypothetical protein
MFPASDDSRYRHEADLSSWKHDGQSLKSSLKYGPYISQNGKEKHRVGTLVGKDLRTRESAARSNNCVKHSESASRGGEGDGAGVGGRMSTNGDERSAMTGSNTTTSNTWLSVVSPCQAQAQRTPTDNITTIAASHDPHFMLHTGSSSLFRPPVTLPDPVHQRLYPGQYAPIYTTTASSLSPYAAAYSSGQSASLLSPYTALYHQYQSQYGAPTASPSAASAGLLPGHTYPAHIDSYSNLLQNMTNQVQHHASQSNLPRSAMFGSLPHHHPAYNITPTTSPGPVVPRSLTPVQSSSQGHSHSGLDHHRPKDGRSSSPSKDKVHRYSPPHHGHPHGKMHPQDSKDTGYATNRDRMRKYHNKRPEYSPGGMGPPAYPVIHPKDEHSSKRPKTNPSHHPSHTSHGTFGGTRPSSHYPTPHYPPHFMKGSIIQLANGDLRRVEELRTEDFANSAQISSDLKIDSSTVVRVERNEERGTALLGFSVGHHKVQVTVEATLEHPFFVFGRGWSSCSPDRTSQRYGLSCHKLSVGDVCISLTHKDANSRAAELSAQQRESERTNPISERGRHGDRDGRHGIHSTSEHLLLPGTVRRDITSFSSLSHHRTVEMPPGSASTLLSQPPALHSRKRRWSAPDQMSALSAELAAKGATSKVLTSSSHEENSSSNSADSASRDNTRSLSPGKTTGDKLQPAKSDSSHA